MGMTYVVGEKPQLTEKSYPQHHYREDIYRTRQKNRHGGERVKLTLPLLEPSRKKWQQCQETG